MLTNGLSSGAVRMAPQRRQERHCGRRWQHGAARRPAGAARPSLASEAAARENTLRRDTVPMSRKFGAPCTTYCTAAAPRRAQTSRRRAATMPFGGLCGMGACPLGCSTTAVRRAAAHDVLPLAACQPAGARAPARSPGWQSADRHLQRCDRQHPVRGGCGLRGQGSERNGGVVVRRPSSLCTSPTRTGYD